MCVIGKTVKQIDATYVNKRLSAWKVFQRKGSSLYPMYWQVDTPYTVGMWNYAVNHKRKSIKRPPYNGTSGFWSFKTRQSARDYVKERNVKFGRTNLSIRKVTLAGYVIEHETGYRSTYLVVEPERR